MPRRILIHIFSSTTTTTTTTTVKELQKPPYWALLHTTESANVKVQNIFHGRNNITCSTNCKYRTAGTLYTLETCFFFGFIIVNTLHKGENKYYDDDDDEGTCMLLLSTFLIASNFPPTVR
jgi:hypothetical protein